MRTRQEIEKTDFRENDSVVIVELLLDIREYLSTMNKCVARIHADTKYLALDGIKNTISNGE